MQRPSIGDFLMSLYCKVEDIRVSLWEQASALRDSSGELEDPGERLRVAYASFEDGVLRVTVEGPPPHRKALLKKPKLRSMWCYTVADAVQELRKRTGLPIVYERALVQVVCWAPVSSPWDADNVGFRYMVNGLVLARVVPDDSWDRMAVLIAGGVDRRRPRVEIFVEDAVVLEGTRWLARMSERDPRGEADGCESGQENRAVRGSDIIIGKEFAPIPVRNKPVYAQDQFGHETRPENGGKQTAGNSARKGTGSRLEKAFW